MKPLLKIIEVKIKNPMIIGVIGAGTIGSGIALHLACYNHQVLLKDISEPILIEAKKKIEDDYKLLKMMRKEVIQDISEIISNIRFTASYNNFKNVDLIIENIPENWEKKQKLYLELRENCSERVIYAINTSCIPITKIGSRLPYPDKVIGMHFMNPVFLKDIVEITKGYNTSEETIEFIKNFVKSIKKTLVIVNDSPGFVANRLSHLFMNEAMFLIYEGVAEPKDIDIIFKKGYGHPMGPLETADLIGLDTVMNSLEILYNEFQDPKFRCCPLLRKMVDAGLLGKKSGKGFYKY